MIIIPTGALYPLKSFNVYLQLLTSMWNISLRRNRKEAKTVTNLRIMKSESEVTQSCPPTLCDPMDCSPPGSSVYGVLQARILEWVAISFSRESSRPRDWTQVSHTVDRRFTVWATREVSTLNIHWKDWSSNTLAIWCKQSTHWKTAWCRERLKAKGEGDSREDG